MTATTTPNLQLNNGVQMPVIGLGVFQTPPRRDRRDRRIGHGRRGGPEPDAITLETFNRDIPEA
jgi:hypothetical protein